VSQSPCRLCSPRYVVYMGGWERAKNRQPG
jgi:hypothetical protein